MFTSFWKQYENELHKWDTRKVHEREVGRNTILSFYMRMPRKCVEAKMIEIIHHAKCTSGATHLPNIFIYKWELIQTMRWQKPRKQNSLPNSKCGVCWGAGVLPPEVYLHNWGGYAVLCHAICTWNFSCRHAHKQIYISNIKNMSWNLLLSMCVSVCARVKESENLIYARLLNRKQWKIHHASVWTDMQTGILVLGCIESNASTQCVLHTLKCRSFSYEKFIHRNDQVYASKAYTKCGEKKVKNLNMENRYHNKTV